MTRFARRTLLLTILLVGFGAVASGGQTGSSTITPAPEASQPVAEPAPLPDGTDPWGFEDEVKAETWRDVLRPQALDLALMSSFFAFALVSFFKKSKPLKYVALGMAVVYLGFAKSFLISVTNIFSVVDWNWPIFKYNLAWYLFAGFTLFSTILWGRLYCGRICAYGALTQLLDAIVPARFRYEVPKAIERRASWIKYGLLVFVIGYYIATRDIMVYRFVEPFWMFGLSEKMVMWIALGSLLLATVFVRNLYCRFACPVGAALGVISQLTTVFSIKRWSECKSCKICEKACEWGAIDGPRIIKSECVRCDDCERIYDDKQKCVHWLIVVKKETLAARARQTAVPASTS